MSKRKSLSSLSIDSPPLSLGTLAATQNAKPSSSPEHINGLANPATRSSMRGSTSAFGLPALPPNLKRSDPTPSPANTFSCFGSGFDQGQFNGMKRFLGVYHGLGIWVFFRVDLCK
ncbi:hypothetical protein QN277_017322 [Acacia crassicarpa]|uniref:Uncharacterized protein n=1 Tax=Acacia crassicarpa TaxID=499986 RepID=A0AAE1MRP9_9FABA|nr:hypothetical protein QN277_017322 [Acacia crassicarpa]